MIKSIYLVAKYFVKAAKFIAAKAKSNCELLIGAEDSQRLIQFKRRKSGFGVGGGGVAMQRDWHTCSATRAAH